MRESDWLDPPFLSGRLEPLNWSSDPDELNRLKKTPGIIIRWFEDREIDQAENSIEVYQSKAQNALHVFSRLSGKSVNIPVLGSVIAARKNKWGGDTVGVCTAVKEIDGESIDKMKALPNNSLAQLDQLIVTLLEDMHQAYREGRPSFTDLTPNQFVYGHPVGSNEPDQWWLVDVGPEGVDEQLSGKGWENRMKKVEELLWQLKRWFGVQLPQAERKLQAIKKKM